MTPLGRVAILKSPVLSKIMHLRILLPNLPGEYFSSLQKLCYEFVWNKKPDKSNRKTVHKSVQKGGLGLPHLKTFIAVLKLYPCTKIQHSFCCCCQFVGPSSCDCISYTRTKAYIVAELTASKSQSSMFWDSHILT